MRLVIALLFLSFAAPALAQHDAPEHDGSEPGNLVRVPFDVGLWSDLSISDALVRDTTERVLNHLALALPYHRADRLEGIALGIFGTMYEESVTGVQVAGLANVVGEEAAVIQLAGLANVVGERMRGMQVAGLANVIGEDGGYVQLSGLASVAGERFVGWQGSGLAGISGEGFSGIQTSGLASIAGEAFGGVQVSGLVSISGEETIGIQSAGLANIAGERMTGVQAAGLANVVGEDFAGGQVALFNVVGEQMRGVQIGVVNVAVESAGLQLGLVNVAGEQRGIPVGLYSRTGGVPVRLDVWTDETAALHVGLRTGSDVVSNFAGISTRPFADAPFRWGVFAGLGVERPLAERLTWGIDAFVHALFAEDFGDYGGTLVRLRGVLARSVSRRTAIFGGGGASLFVSDAYDGDGLAPFSIYDDAGDTLVRVWPGLEAGVRVRLTDS